jgi:hypothetical protein
MGLELTPTGIVQGLGDTAELRAIVGEGSMSDEAWGKFTGITGEIMGLAGTYAVQKGAYDKGQSAFAAKLKEINAARTKAGLEALKNDPQTLKRLQAKTKGEGSLTDTELQYLHAYQEFIPQTARREQEATLKKLEEYARAQLGEEGAAKVVQWAKEQSAAITQGLDGMDLKKEEEKARKGAGKETFGLSGSVRLVVEDDALKLLFDMANAKKETPKKGGTGD